MRSSPYRRRPLAKELLIFVRSHNPLNDVRNWNSIVVNPYFYQLQISFFFRAFIYNPFDVTYVRKSRHSYQKVYRIRTWSSLLSPPYFAPPPSLLHSHSISLSIVVNPLHIKYYSQSTGVGSVYGYYTSNAIYFYFIIVYIIYRNEIRVS